MRDRLGVTFAAAKGANPPGSFKDRGMAMASSPVLARLDAAFAPPGR